MWEKTKPYLLVLPGLLVIGGLFGGGLWEGLLQSLGYFPALGQTHVTVKAYFTLFQSNEFWESLVTTFRIALLSFFCGRSGVIHCARSDDAGEKRLC